jgi:hypothetical protein
MIYPSPADMRQARGEGGVVMDYAYDVLSALRLGWSVAEMRGRNRPDGPPGRTARTDRPDGPPGEVVGMPDHLDHPT